MSDYDPRSETGIPTEPVGSLPRPSTLQAAYAAYDKGEIDKAALEKEQDAAVEDSIEHLEATGSPIISDGEQRWSSFATYPHRGHAGRHRPGRQPGRRRAVLRHLRRRPRPPAAPPDRRPVHATRPMPRTR